MAYKRLSESDYRFMCIIWNSEPVGSTELVRVCAEKLGWKKSTTYTMLKRLIEKGFVKNDDSVVTTLVSREWVRANESDLFVEQTFDGSLPGFIVAFLGGKKLLPEEAKELKRLIDNHTR